MKKIFILFIGLLTGISAYAQFENKLNAFAYTGFPKFTKEDGGQAFKNVFNGYKPLPYIGFGLDYAFNLKFAIGPSVRFIYNSKSNYKIPNTTVGLEMKYNFVPNDKKVSPFIVSEVNVSYLSITQEAFFETKIINERADTKEAMLVSTTKEYKENSISLDNVPGLTFGLGSDFTLKQKYGVFLSFNYMMTSAHKQAKLLEVYPDNTSKYSYFLLKAGIKFGFLRSNKL